MDAKNLNTDVRKEYKANLKETINGLKEKFQSNPNYQQTHNYKDGLQTTEAMDSNYVCEWNCMSKSDDEIKL